MYVILSKLVWLVVSPVNLLIFITIAGAALCFTRFLRLGRGLALGGGLGLALIGFVPIGDSLLSILEARFPRYVEAGRPPDGIIVLGGAEEPFTALAHDVLALNDSAERLIAFADLARRFPHARLVYAGGSSVTPGLAAEADLVRRHASELGLPVERVLFEARSRNTYENAVLSKALAEPKPGETWLLVTSAWHMPRAMGLFRKAGFEVTAHPVDYRGPRTPAITGLLGNAADGHRRFERATREFLGLAAAYALGKTDEFLPSAQSSRGSDRR